MKMNATIHLERPEIDCSPFMRKIPAGRTSMLAVDQALTKARLPLILSNIEPGKQTLLFSFHIGGDGEDAILTMLVQAINKRYDGSERFGQARQCEESETLRTLVS
jgi:hypothetical protein